MSNLIINAPTPPSAELPISSSEFWPAVDPVKIREAQRIDNTVTPTRLRATLIEAIASTNGSLSVWRLEQVALGNATLAAIDGDEVDSLSILVHRYNRAVGCLTKALLLERLRDFDTSGKGDRRADAMIDPIEDCRRDHLNAIADIAGRARITVELI
jgi:hypothetical protein